MQAQTPHEEASVSEIQQLIDRMPVARIARQAGVEQDDARRALEAVLPALVGGMQANAQDPAGAASLERALTRHEGLLSARAADDGDADVDEGQRIVRNVFGGQTDQVVSALGGAGGGGLGDVVRKVLPIVAPIVMAWLAERLFSGGGATGAGSTRAQAPTSSGGQTLPTSGDNPFANSGGGAGGGSLRVPSGQQGSQQQSDGGGLGDLLGGILGGGGGQQQSGGGILGDLLGGLLGGGRR